jgi:hypothetical protein
MSSGEGDVTRAVKAVPPGIPSWFVARPGLESRLDETFERRLTYGGVNVIYGSENGDKFGALS